MEMALRRRITAILGCYFFSYWRGQLFCEYSVLSPETWLRRTNRGAPFEN